MNNHIDIKQNINESIRKWKNSYLYFTSILNSIHLVIIIIDNNGRIKLTNPAADKAWEWDSRECSGKHIQELDWGDSPGKLEYYLAEAKKTAERQSLETFHFKRKDGSERFFHLDFVPLLDELDRTTGTIIIGTDITEKKELEREKQLLEGLLPICSYCKKIRHGHNEWTVMEKYIRDHSEARFTHSVCPQCMEKHFPSS
ncbi:MAG: PAS domain S-box protein [bacterium]